MLCTFCAKGGMSKWETNGEGSDASGVKEKQVRAARKGTRH